MVATTVAAGPTDVERLILAGDFATAAKSLPDAAAPEAEEPAWARLRLLLLLTGVLPADAEGQRADARAVVPAEGQPPADLPALLSTAAAANRFEEIVDVERRLMLAAGSRAQGLLERGETQAAHDLLEQALAALTPSASLFRLFGRVNDRLGRPSDAVFALERAVDFDPADRATRIELATTLPGIGDCGRAARMLEDDAVGPEERQAFSSRLHAMAATESDPTALATQTLRYREASAARLAPVRARGPVPEVPRVAFLWHQDQRGAGFWMTDLLRHRTPGRYHATLYGVSLTRRFEASELGRLVDQVVVCGRVATTALPQRMQADETDLLVSFAGHGRPDMLAVLDRRPARAHVEWLESGWPSGHPAVSHLVADRSHCPPELGRMAGIRVAAFPTTAISGGPALAAADAAGRARTADGVFAYGWCGPAERIGERTLAAWARILVAHPAAHLRLLHDDWRVGAAQERVAVRLMELGVEGRRIEFGSPDQQSDQIRQWARIDLGLDSFPAGDIATTMEALAMGVPLVTLAGPRHAGRHGAVAQATVGLNELITTDEDSYVAKALEMAARPAVLAQLRERLPEAMRGSPLAGTPIQARSFEAAIDLLLGIRRGG